MPKAPDARAEQARDMFLSGKKLIEISEILKVPEGTVRSWKNRYKWGNATLQKKKGERNVAKKHGGQPGNKNAVGNRGGSAPKGNKNALKTGEFETIFFDTLDDKEKQLAQAIPLDKERLLLQEIQLLTIRERRMLKRIAELKQTAGGPSPEEEGAGVAEKAPLDMTVTKYTSGYEKGKWTDLKEYTGILGQIQSIEDALTRVQEKKQKAIDSLHRFGFDDARLEKMDETEKDNDVVQFWAGRILKEREEDVT